MELAQPVEQGEAGVGEERWRWGWRGRGETRVLALKEDGYGEFVTSPGIACTFLPAPRSELAWSWKAPAGDRGGRDTPSSVL